jgi:predicted nucleic acid-binding protein
LACRFRATHTALLERILGLRENFSAYDATYVALAASLESVFVTCDDALARALRRFFPGWDVRT